MRRATIELLATEYVRPSTRTTNASGKNSSESRLKAMAAQAAHRSNDVARITNR